MRESLAQMGKKKKKITPQILQLENHFLYPSIFPRPFCIKKKKKAIIAHLHSTLLNFQFFYILIILNYIFWGIINLDLACTYVALNHPGTYASFPSGFIIPGLTLCSS